MMKKIITIVFMALLILSISSCVNEREVDDSINVMFFTANKNASLVPSYTNLTEGQKIEEPDVPTREGFTFVAWYKDYYNTEKWNFDEDTVGSEPMVLYAGWEPSIFEITYILNGGTMPTAEYVQTFAGGEFAVLPLPTQEGFIFTAWYTYDWKDDNGEITTIPGDSGHQKIPEIFEDIVLYAHWEPIVVDVKFNINYPGDDEPELDVVRMNVNYGDVIDFPVPEDTDKYQFGGWNVKRDGTGDFYLNGDLFERKLRLTLYALWIEK